MVVLGIGWTWEMLGNVLKNRSRILTFLILSVVMAYPPGLLATGKSMKLKNALVVREHMNYINQHTTEDAIILSDQSYAIAWYSKRRSIRNHVVKDDDGFPMLALLEFNEEFLPIQGLYLSAVFFNDRFWYRTFENLVRRTDFKDIYPLEKIFPDGARFYYRSQAIDETGGTG